jgi:uncharacterized protein
MTASSPPELTIPVHDLDAGGREVHLALGRGWLAHALDGTGFAPGDAGGQLDVRLSKSGTDVVIHGELRGELFVPCARCLEPARVVVHEHIAALAVPASAIPGVGAGAVRGASDEDPELGSDDDDVIPYDGETIVLDDLVRDELVLAVPMIPLCSESCPGIAGSRDLVGRRGPSPASGSGASDEVDPRLRPLLALKTNSLKKS